MKFIIVNIFGGLGNQMFQYALYLNLKKNEVDKMVLFVNLPYKDHNGFELHKVFNIQYSNILNFSLKLFRFCFFRKGKRYYEKPGALFNSNIFSIIKKNKFLNLIGYWQSEKYFFDATDNVKNVFTFNIGNLSLKSYELMNFIIKDKNVVSIHIRRGDYITNIEANKVHGDICDLLYYERAIEYFLKKNPQSKFIFFSDDIIWIHENFKKIKNKIIVDWNSGQNSWQDMFLMSVCRNNIIANSSFSWWAAWLNQNSDKIVVRPEKWFNNLSYDDICPENWIKL